MSDRDDPLNDILLPASDLAKRIKNGDRSSKAGEKLLAGALLILLAERDSMRWLYREAVDSKERQQMYVEALESETTPAARDRARGLLRLHHRPWTNSIT